MRLPTLLVVLNGLVPRTLAQINLGTAAPFGIIASTAISNTGATIINGELGLFPNTESSITGFPPGLSGDVHAADGVADQALSDAQTAYNVAASLASTSPIAGADLGGQTLVAGTYTSSSSVLITGTLTLDGQNNPGSLFVFQIGSTLTTASSSSIVLINGAQACNIFFQVGSSATLGASTVFNGNILASVSVSLGDGVIVNGGLFALTGAVTLINDLVTAQRSCVSGSQSSTIDDRTSTSLGSSSLGPNSTPTTTTAGEPPTSVPSDGVTSISTTTTLPGVGTVTVPSIDVPSTFSGDFTTVTIPRSSILTTRPERSFTTTFSTLPSQTTMPDIPNVSTSSNREETSKKPTTSSSYSVITTSSLSSWMRTSSRTTLSQNSSAPFQTSKTTGYKVSVHSASSTTKVYLYTTSRYLEKATRSALMSSSQYVATQARPVTASKVYDTVTVINGTPCTTLSYYEQTCSCTKTTVVPVAYAPAPTTIDVTLVSGLPCTATQYYEEDCDCIRSSMVPIPVVTASADIVTVINDIPCVTSKYYEPACNCIQTSTIPVRIGSAGETAVTATAVACTQTVNNM